MRYGFKQDPPAQLLHFSQGPLELAPLSDGALEPLKLLLGQRHTDGFAFDLASPLVTGAAGARSAVLDVAFADPAGLSQALAQASVLSLPLR